MAIPSRYPENPHETYAMRVLLALDRLWNALTGGDDRETISERTGRAIGDNALADALAVFLDMLDPGHVVDVNDRLTDEERAAIREKLDRIKALLPTPESRATQEYQAP